MYPRNGYSEEGQDKDHLKFKKKGKKLNHHQKQKPKYKHQYFENYEEDIDEILQDGMNLDLKKILGDEDED